MDTVYHFLAQITEITIHMYADVGIKKAYNIKTIRSQSSTA